MIIFIAPLHMLWIVKLHHKSLSAHNIPLMGCMNMKNISAMPTMAWGWVGICPAPCETAKIMMKPAIARRTAVIWSAKEDEEEEKEGRRGIISTKSFKYPIPAIQPEPDSFGSLECKHGWWTMPWSPCNDMSGRLRYPAGRGGQRQETWGYHEGEHSWTKRYCMQSLCCWPGPLTATTNRSKDH